MLKVEIELDENKLLALGRNVEEAHGEIRAYFGRYPKDIEEITTDPKTLTFKGLDTEDSWASLILCSAYFPKNISWFQRCATKALWYNSDEGRNEEDFEIEDVLDYYRKKGLMVQNGGN